MLRVMIVDDIATNVDLLEQLLEENYDLVIGRSGREAVELATSEKPALILMDIAMPEMSGTEAMQAIKANPTLSDIPIVAVTSHAMRGDQATMMEAGFDEYLSKPVDEELLFEVLERLLPKGV